jgi:hypothetical protein
LWVTLNSHVDAPVAAGEARPKVAALVGIVVAQKL